MVSTKFKAGHRVYFISSTTGYKYTGTVVSFEEATRRDEGFTNNYARVWAKWDDDNHVSYMLEVEVHSLDSKIKRNLPSWF